MDKVTSIRNPKDIQVITCIYLYIRLLIFMYSCVPKRTPNTCVFVHIVFYFISQLNPS